MTNHISLRPYSGRYASARATSRIENVRQVLLVMPLVGFLLQLTQDLSASNLFCALLASVGSFLVFFDSFRPRRLYLYPMSTLAVLGCGTIFLLLPPLITAPEGRPIIFNLYVPEATFLHSFLAAMVFVTAHALYRHSLELYRLRLAVQKILLSCNIFRPLQLREAIILSILGFLPQLARAGLLPIPPGSQLLKFIEGFEFLFLIPLAYLFQSLWFQPGQREDNQSRSAFLLFLAFFSLILVFSIIRNTRSLFITPLALLMFGIGLAYLYNLVTIRLRSIVALILSILIVIPVATDLATAMLVVRAIRTDVTPTELISATLEQFQDKESLRQYREELSPPESQDLGYSEVYSDNLFISRFSNPKHIDNPLEWSSYLDPESKVDFVRDTLVTTLSILPRPLFELTGFPFAIKQQSIRSSIGDKLYYYASRSPTALGGFRSVIFPGVGMAAFGYSYLLIVFVGLLFVFPLLDAHCLPGVESTQKPPHLSLMALFSLFSWFLLALTASTPLDFITFPFRPFAQTVILLALARWFIRRI